MNTVGKTLAFSLWLLMGVLVTEKTALTQPEKPLVTKDYARDARLLADKKVNHQLREITALTALGRLELAKKLVDDELLKYPGFYLLVYQRGNILRELADFDEIAYKNSLRDLTAVVQVHPEYHPAWNALAGLSRRRGLLKEALSYAQSAAHCPGADHISYRELMLAYSLLGNEKKAEEACAIFERKTMEQAAKGSEKKERIFALQGRLILYQNLKDLPKAILAYRELVKISPKSQNVHWESDSLITLNRRQEALKVLGEALVANPEDDQIYIERGRLLAKMGKNSQALADYERAIALEPTSVAFRERAAIYTKLGKPDLAKKDIEKASGDKFNGF